jgi:hypothetical protein
MGLGAEFASGRIEVGPMVKYLNDDILGNLFFYDFGMAQLYILWKEDPNQFHALTKTLSESDGPSQGIELAFRREFAK